MRYFFKKSGRFGQSTYVIRQEFSEAFSIVFVEIEEIKRAPSGKYRFMMTKIKKLT